MHNHFTSLLYFILLFSISFAVNTNDPIFNAATMAKDSSLIQSLRIRVASENIANSNVVTKSCNKKPFIRKVVFIRKNKNRIHPVVSLVKKKRFKKVYLPNHFSADNKGYVLFPNINIDIEKADIMESKNLYELNTIVFSTSHRIIKNTINTLKH